MMSSAPPDALVSLLSLIFIRICGVLSGACHDDGRALRALSLRATYNDIVLYVERTYLIDVDFREIGRPPRGATIRRT